MKPTKETNKEFWTAQVWPGNPALNLVCSAKIFVNPFNARNTPIFIYGGTKERPTFSFCVSAGAKSDYSYTGGIPSEIYEIDKAELFVDDLYKRGKIFS